MNKRIMIVALVAIGVTAFWAGAAFSGPQDEADKPGVPQPPPPPAELKALEPFVGQWKATYEFLPAMFGKPGKGTSVGAHEWVLDRRFLMGKFRGTGSFGDYESISVMTYDPMMKSYRYFGFDCHGSCDIATMTYDAEAKTWTALSDTVDMTGKPAKSKAVLRFVSKDKIEWEWSVKASGATDFALWMKGTDERVPQGE